jgi:hypothetical protein
MNHEPTKPPAICRNPHVAAELTRIGGDRFLDQKAVDHLERAVSELLQLGSSTTTEQTVIGLAVWVDDRATRRMLDLVEGWLLHPGGVARGIAEMRKAMEPPPPRQVAGYQADDKAPGGKRWTRFVPCPAAGLVVRLWSPLTRPWGDTDLHVAGPEQAAAVVTQAMGRAIPLEVGETYRDESDGSGAAILTPAQAWATRP